MRESEPCEVLAKFLHNRVFHSREVGSICLGCFIGEWASFPPSTWFVGRREPPILPTPGVLRKLIFLQGLDFSNRG